MSDIGSAIARLKHDVELFRNEMNQFTVDVQRAEDVEDQDDAAKDDPDENRIGFELDKLPRQDQLSDEEDDNGSHQDQDDEL